jgi:hypothetical protein
MVPKEKAFSITNMSHHSQEETTISIAIVAIIAGLALLVGFVLQLIGNELNLIQ